MNLPQLKKLYDEYHVFGTSLTRVRGHEILKELAGSFPALHAALVDMHETLKILSEYTHDDGPIFRNEYQDGYDDARKLCSEICKVSLNAHAALFNETKETK